MTVIVLKTFWQLKEYFLSGIYVDVIHTDSTFFGAPTPSGTADFWPNGGQDQPDCPLANWNIYSEESKKATKFLFIEICQISFC